MTVSEVIQKMIVQSNGSLRDICHFLKVYAYAKTIGEIERLDPPVQLALEVAAVLHDIACPLCRSKYGNTNAEHQEREGARMAEEFLADSGFPEPLVRRVVYLVGHHHTLEPVDGLDHRILLEADYLVNADEGGHSRQQILSAQGKLFRTGAGLSLLRSIYQLPQG